MSSVQLQIEFINEQETPAEETFTEFKEIHVKSEEEMEDETEINVKIEEETDDETEINVKSEEETDDETEINVKSEEETDDETEINVKSEEETDDQRGLMDFRRSPRIVSDGKGSTSRRERTHISEEAKVFLQKAYEEGMTRVGSPLVGAASQATGLPPFVIDNWIGNYRRKKTSSSQPKNKKLHTKDLSGYNLFCRDLLKNKGSLKDITQKWSTLGEVEKRKYAEEAAALKVQRTSDDMSPETRSLKVKKHLKQIKTEKVASLEKLGVETGVMMFDHQKPFLDVLEVSSKGASSFFDRTDVLDNFALHFKGNSSSTSAVKQPVDTMVKKVQELFNRKYNEAGGRGRLPYISIQNESIIINASGLPDGITLKKPCHYGRKQLEVILKNAEQISFQINSGRKIRPTVEDIFNVMCGNAYKKFVDDIDFSKYSLCNMIAMDEIAVFMGQAAQTTIDRGASSVYVPSTAYESARVTCILTIRLDGTKATPLLIAKGKKEKIERVSGIYVLETEKAWATQDVIRK
ncbi:PREDICTED: uncharacterized protein LOC106909023 isoform X5 [Poecilia mexicana]|uniref:uncharacterized protein LOC106909023 isoform X5 n=1 Tax=Poecilia mexicana TaxID=48701 RepID=UPI00072EBC65|nr:PREDICTED: uncharacterized protein LOC106909023 isoform X5 [Poecilia mexicana]